MPDLHPVAVSDITAADQRDDLTDTLRELDDQAHPLTASFDHAGGPVRQCATPAEPPAGVPQPPDPRESARLHPRAGRAAKPSIRVPSAQSDTDARPATVAGGCQRDQAPVPVGGTGAKRDPFWRLDQALTELDAAYRHLEAAQAWLNDEPSDRWLPVLMRLGGAANHVGSARADVRKELR